MYVNLEQASSEKLAAGHALLSMCPELTGICSQPGPEMTDSRADWGGEGRGLRRCRIWLYDGEHLPLSSLLSEAGM